MELKLAKSEKIVKSWDYAVGGGMFTKAKRKIQANLTATNKRIVYSAYNDLSLERKEIAIKDVKAIDGNYARNPKLLAIIKLVFGCIFTVFIVGIIFKFGIRWIKDAIDTLKGAKLELTVVTNCLPGVSLEIAAQQKVIKFQKEKFKVSVDKIKAKEILDELGALVLDVKEEA